MSRYIINVDSEGRRTILTALLEHEEQIKKASDKLTSTYGGKLVKQYQAEQLEQIEKVLDVVSNAIEVGDHWKIGNRQHD